MNYKLLYGLTKKLKKPELMAMIDAALGRAIRYYDDYALAIIYAKNADSEVIEYLCKTIPIGGLISIGGPVLDMCDIGKDGLYPPKIELFLKLRDDRINSRHGVKV